MDKSDFNKSQYEAHYKTYLESNADNLIGGGTNEERVDLLRKYLPSGSSVLEIGSGGGDDALALEKAGFKVTPSEFVRGFIDVMTDKGLNPILLDAKKDKLPTRDAIYANAVFVHFSPSEVQEFLDKASDSLTGEKVLFFSVIKGAGSEVSARNRGFEREFHYYTLERLSPLLKKSGFETVHAEDKGPKWLQIIAKAK